MSLPSDGWGILVYLTLIVPGIVFIMVRSQLRGFRDVDRTVGARILLAFVVSAIFDAVYVGMFGQIVAERFQDSVGFPPEYVSSAAWLFVLLGIVIPAGVSWIIYGDGRILRPIHHGFDWMRRHLTNSRYEATPTAWDLAATTTEAAWVRVWLGQGTWVGGRFGDNSYFSTYPEPRDLFIELQYHMGSGGAFLEPVASSAGVWVSVKDDYVVEWLKDAEEGLEDDGEGRQAEQGHRLKRGTSCIRRFKTAVGDWKRRWVC